MGERSEPLSKITNEKKMIPSIQDHMQLMSRLTSVSVCVIARQHRRCMLVGCF